MDIGLTSGTCSNCKGLDACNKVCILHAGRALVNFITKADMIETRIGEYSSRKKGDKPDLVVYGHQLYDLKSPSWLLTDINTSLDASDKFRRLYDKTAFQIVSAYCKYVNMSSEETKEITDKIKKLNSNKLIILPFKPRTQCSIDYTVDGVTEKKKDAEIAYLKWVTNKENHKIECTIGFSVASATGNSTVKLPITDYISKFRLSQMEMQAKNNKYDKKMISINDYGIIKPIVVKQGNASVAIDSTYVYCSVSGETSIIGYWDEYDKLVLKPNIKSAALDKIKDNADYIKNHKRYIAPYLLYEPNIVEI